MGFSATLSEAPCCRSDLLEEKTNFTLFVRLSAFVYVCMYI